MDNLTVPWGNSINFVWKSTPMVMIRVSTNCFHKIVEQARFFQHSHPQQEPLLIISESSLPFIEDAKENIRANIPIVLRLHQGLNDHL